MRHGRIGQCRDLPLGDAGRLAVAARRATAAWGRARSLPFVRCGKFYCSAPAWNASDAPAQASPRKSHHRSHSRRPSSRSRCCCRAAVRWAPTRPASTRRCTRPGCEPDWVAGISIGAINCALIAGNPPETPASSDCATSGRRSSPPPLRHAGPGRRSTVEGDLRARSGSTRSAPSACSLGGAPQFFTPRLLPPFLQPRGSAGGAQLLRHRRRCGRRSSAWSISTCSTAAPRGSASVPSTSAPATSSISTPRPIASARST